MNRIDPMGAPNVANAGPEFGNVVSNVPWLSFHKAFYC